MISLAYASFLFVNLPAYQQYRWLQIITLSSENKKVIKLLAVKKN